MNIQIFGLKKCSDSRKAQRFFKERQIRFQFIDLSQKGLSKGELRSVAARVPLTELIDRSGPRFVAKGLTHASLNGGRITQSSSSFQIIMTCKCVSHKCGALGGTRTAPVRRGQGRGWVRVVGPHVIVGAPLSRGYNAVR